MPVRNSAKAIVLRDGKILVNRCTSRFGNYYALPGGGQREGETLLEAVRRELLEETGYAVVPVRLSGIYERVCENREGGMSHKIYFVFLCRLTGSRGRRLPSATASRWAWNGSTPPNCAAATSSPAPSATTCRH